MADSSDNDKLCRTDIASSAALIVCGGLGILPFAVIVDFVHNFDADISSTVIVAPSFLLPFVSALSGDLRRQTTARQADSINKALKVAYRAC